ncbi:IS110 family transposase [Paenibacillus sp. VTT E-133280]|uniref:IS110 family transposase n=1 Tax=unclassified Paenibacillus TaxID=185978 RepID=UPI000BA14256|nr:MULTISPECIES: IS110 family transposase [unclassified Paenibacillus]MBY3621330.1 IS110 family transposase [Acinetobacter sp. CUI P1]MDH6373069.1 transposase [Paenibacillus sp. PastF-3]OZQ62264.1 IS110 family transposase [Paenibacillus sp. VTT E-133280]OZQ80922.1 IS110 family transposase [Paenibacillus sp. VTT E-133291]
MKFKSQDRQNQLIEKITAQHLVVGIDIAQQTHVARAVNFRGIVVGNPLSFSNDEEGFQFLLRWIQTLQSTHALTEAIVGMEPTGHYWFSLSNWLSDRQFEVVLVNPHLVRKNKENRDNTPSKSDKKDALVIADMVKNGYYLFIRNTPEAFEELRVFLSNRDSVVTRLVSAKNQIHRWVDVVFPELRQVFKNIMCTGSLATLRLFPTPEELYKLQPQDVLQGWKSVMKRHSGEPKAKALISFASRSVGTKQALHAYKLHLKQLLDEYDLACLQLKTVETEIVAVLKRIPFAESMLAVKGISVISLAGILGEAGDLSGFVHGNALLRHAGLNLAEASSGKWTGQMKISKRGRSRLRRFIFMMTMSLVASNSEFKAMHTYNVQVKKMKKMRSIMKLCGKLARILVGMARSGEAYNPPKTMPIQLAA